MPSVEETIKEILNCRKYPSERCKKYELCQHCQIDLIIVAIREADYVPLAENQMPPIIAVEPIAEISVGGGMELQMTTVEQEARQEKYLISEEIYEACGDDEDMLIAQHNKSVKDVTTPAPDGTKFMRVIIPKEVKA